VDEVLARIAEAARELEQTTDLLSDRTRDLLEMEMLLSAVLGEVDEVVVVVDNDLVVKAMSERAERWLDVEAPEAVGRTLTEVLSDEAALPLVRATRAVAEAGDVESGRELTVAGRSFRIRPVTPRRGAIVIGS
jgi:sensor histidine kinase regulating citrate/malate metabolism